MEIKIEEFTEVPAGMLFTDRQQKVVAQVYTSRSTSNPRNHLNNNIKCNVVNQAQGDTSIYPEVQLTTKACLSSRC